MPSVFSVPLREMAVLYLKKVSRRGAELTEALLCLSYVCFLNHKDSKNTKKHEGIPFCIKLIFILIMHVLLVFLRALCVFVVQNQE